MDIVPDAIVKRSEDEPAKEETPCVSSTIQVSGDDHSIASLVPVVVDLPAAGVQEQPQGRPQRTVKPVVDAYISANKRSIQRVLQKDRVKDMIAEMADWKKDSLRPEEAAKTDKPPMYWVPLTVEDSYATVCHEYYRMAGLCGVSMIDDGESVTTTASSDEDWEEGQFKGLTSYSDEDEEEDEEEEDEEEEDAEADSDEDSLFAEGAPASEVSVTPESKRMRTV